MHLSRILFLLLTINLSISSSAQYRTNLQDYYYRKVIGQGRFAQRMYVGVGTRFISGTATLKYQSYDGGNFSATYSPDLKASNSISGLVGVYFPIALTSEGDNMFTFDLELMAGGSKLIYDSVDLNGKAKYMNATQSLQFGIPFGISYRSGGDVALNKHSKGMFALGAGFFPCIVNSPDINIIIPYKVMPYVRAEAGIFLGIAMKIRATMFFGNSVYDQYTSYGLAKSVQFDQVKGTVKGNNGIMVSLIVLPFSTTWNTYTWK